MAFEVNVYKLDDIRPTAKIRPMSVKRDWIDPDTQHGYAYSCFPLVLANTMGYEIYFDEDIEFIWDGTKDSDSTKVLLGKEICYFDRGFATIGLFTNLVFKSNETTSLLSGPIPNQFIDGIQGYSAIISTSIFGGALNIVLRITQPNKKILIKAGTPIGFVLPISISDINNSVINVFNTFDPGVNLGVHSSKEYNDSLYQNALETNRTVGWYQKALDHKGNKIGQHEIKKFNFSVVSHD